MKMLKGGSNCEIYKFVKNDKELVTKLYHIWNEDIATQIITKHLEIRSHINVNQKIIGIPLLEEIKWENNILSITEEYTGDSLRKILKENKDNAKISLEECLEKIKELPQNIPLDINPANFTIDKNKNIYFIDFMPPDPWQFEQNNKFRTIFEEIFPTAKRIKTSRDLKKRYYTTEYRLQKFLYYINYLDPHHN